MDEALNKGDAVSLASDPQKAGAVIAVDGERITVMLDGKRMAVYREQITRCTYDAEEETSAALNVQEVLAAMSAWQINHPMGTSLFSLGQARIDFVPYQFRPVMAMIKADRARLLIADDVGVGKTIEAGLILKELEARKGITSVLVICPRALVTERKWELEMRRFDEDFTPLDGVSFASAQMDADMDGEWPVKYSKAILPYSLLTEESVTGMKDDDRRHKIKSKRYHGLERLDTPPHFDLVIVDEAHTIRNPATWWCRGVKSFCENADAVVFMTATPLQNKNEDLYTLLGILRPDIVVSRDAFAKMSEPNKDINAVIRDIRGGKDRWKEEAQEHIAAMLETDWGARVIAQSSGFAALERFMNKDSTTREEKIEAVSIAEGLHTFSGMMTRTRRRDIGSFCTRRGQTINTAFNKEERALYDALMDFEKQALSMLHGPNVAFMMCTFKRQAASCIHALVPFIDDVISRRMEELEKLEEFIDWDDDGTITDDMRNVLSALENNVRDAATSLPDDDSKFNELLEFVKNKQSEKNRRVIVFSSFRRTLVYIQKKLAKAGIRVGRVDGGVPYDERRELSGLFRLEKEDPNALDVLLFSEVGSEGLDYQFCDAIVNYDLPWNPMRIEQRIGRIDRRGQKSDVVRICNMIVDGTIDADVYNKCLVKIGIFEDSVGDCAEILGSIGEKLQKIMTDASMTDSERREKLEQMADNEVREIQESRRMEKEDRLLYGVDISEEMAAEAVKRAKNEWVSDMGLLSLVNIYLDKRLEKGDYIKGGGTVKTLRLSQAARGKLLSDMRSLPRGVSNRADRAWRAWLKGEAQTLSVTFDSDVARYNDKTMLLNQTHPLLRVAAAYIGKEDAVTVAARAAIDGVPSGEYAFLVYAWQLTGVRESEKMVAVCDNDKVQSCLFDAIRCATDCTMPSGDFTTQWNDLDAKHHAMWRAARGEHIARMQEDCALRLSQDAELFARLERTLQEAIDKSKDEKILRMKRSQLSKERAAFELRQAKLKEEANKADVLATLVVRGVIVVDGR